MPHKRLLKEGAFTLALPFGFRETLGNLRPGGKRPGQALSGEDRRTDLTHHVLRLTPSAPALYPIRIPRGKCFSRLRSCARPAGW